MAESKPVVTLKDGSKIVLDDVSQVSQYSDRQDLESIAFFGEEELQQLEQTKTVEVKTEAVTTPAPAALINATLSIDTAAQQTVASVEQPKADPVVPKPAPAGDASTTITVAIGALAGALSSAGTPALTNLVKNFLKNKLKGKKSSQPKEEEPEEPTDCKTHQLKSNAKIAKMAARITALENKPTNYKEQESNFGTDTLSDLEERIEKLEKQLKAASKKGKK